MNVIVLNDLRPANIITCLHLWLKYPNSKIVSSELFFRFGDYGDPFLESYLPRRTTSKILSIWLVRFLCFCRILVLVRALNHKHLSAASAVGVRSSMASITCDSNASKLKYPDLFDHLSMRALGAESIVDYIADRKISKLFLFNGRTASSSQIAYACYLNSIAIRYYEFAALSSRSYALYPFPPHSSHRIGIELASFYQTGQLSLHGFNELNLLQNNKFSLKCKENPSESHDLIVILGSPHEYSNLIEEVVGITYIGNLNLIHYVASHYYAEVYSVAVRAHPNMINDPSCKCLELQYQSICSQYGFTFYGASSAVDTRILVDACEVVVVEYSSLAYYALLRGKQVDIVGDLDVKHSIHFLQDAGYEISQSISLALRIHLASQVFYDVRLPFLLSLLRKVLVVVDLIIASCLSRFHWMWINIVAD